MDKTSNRQFNTNQIKEGNTYKNYKELCHLLGDKEKYGNSKIAQIKDWKRYFDYEKDGRKFTIHKIYDVPIMKISNSIYIEIIKALILDLLIGSDFEKVASFSRSQLLRKLEMVNYNYSYAKNKQMRLSKFTDIPISEIRDFYTTSDDLFKYNLEKALDDLEDRAVFSYEKVNFVCVTDVYTYQSWDNKIAVHMKEKLDEFGDSINSYTPDARVRFDCRPATIDETNLINDTVDEMLEKYRFEKVSDVLRSGIKNEFFDEVNKILLAKKHIAYYYKGYQIIFNREKIRKKWKDACFKLRLNNKDNQKEVMNHDICEKVKSNAKKRHEEAMKPFGGRRMNPSKREMRQSKNYVENEYILTNLLINREASSIVNQLENYYKKYK